MKYILAAAFILVATTVVVCKGDDCPPPDECPSDLCSGYTCANPHGLVCREHKRCGGCDRIWVSQEDYNGETERTCHAVKYNGF